MHFEVVSFFSAGVRLSAHFYRPPIGSPQYPAVVFCAGFTGTKDALEGAAECVESGYGLLAFDHRGWGHSEGTAGTIYPMEQVHDIRAALSYLEGRPDVDSDRLGLLGHSFGGGNASYTAAIDTRVRCAVSVFGLGDGRQWLHEMRSQWEWQQFLQDVCADRIRRAQGSEERLVDPTESIMIASPERRTLKGHGIDVETPFSCAEAILDYRPVEFVHGITPRAMMWIATEGDTVVSASHSRRLYECAGEPKKLVVFPSDEHYGAYEGFRQEINAHTLDWLDRYLVSRDQVVLEST